MARVYHAADESLVSTGPTVIDQGGLTVTRLIYFILNIFLVLLGLRFVLRLLGASSANDLVNLLYSMTVPLVAPFTGIFPAAVLDGNSVLEWSTIIAMAAYALIAYALVRLVQILTTRPLRSP